MPETHNRRIVILDDWEGICDLSPAVERLRRSLPVTIYRCRLVGEDLRAAVADASILVPFRERSPISRELLEGAEKLELIAQTGSGVAHIDLEAARDRGIPICLTPGGSSHSVAELVLGLALASDHRIVAGDRLISAGRWQSMLGRDVRGQTLGLLGYGITARAVAPLAVALGLNVIAWSRSLTRSDVPSSVSAAATLEYLLANSDILSVHLPLTEQTRGLLSAERLATLKPGALLINTSRGPILDHDALIAALDVGRLRGACLDVFDPEPLPADHPLRGRPDVVLTPHVGWTTVDTMHRFLEGCEKNILAFLAGSPTNMVLHR